MRYRKKPIVIDAIQYDGENLNDIFYKFPDLKCTMEADLSNAFGIYTLEGKMLCTVGDYLIRGVKGEFYPCKPDIFEATYEEVK